MRLKLEGKLKEILGFPKDNREYNIIHKGVKYSMGPFVVSFDVKNYYREDTTTQYMFFKHLVDAEDFRKSLDKNDIITNHCLYTLDSHFWHMNSFDKKVEVVETDDINNVGYKDIEIMTVEREELGYWWLRDRVYEIVNMYLSRNIPIKNIMVSKYIYQSIDKTYVKLNDKTVIPVKLDKTLSDKSYYIVTE